MGGIVMVFPVLQRIPWLFPSTRRAFNLVKEFEEVALEIASSSKHSLSREDDGTILSRLTLALKDKTFSDFQYRSNLKQLLLAGHEEVEAVLLSAIVELAKNPQLQTALHAELCLLSPATYSLQDLNKLPLLMAIILETLRLHPPFPSLTNRYTTEQVWLGGSIDIPAGTWIGWNAYGVQTNPHIWGIDALAFRPSRWGQDITSINAMFRIQKAKAVFIPFSTYARTCLGVAFALMQLKVALYELFSTMEWGVDDNDLPSISAVCWLTETKEETVPLS
jgi:unspecific monooxygenase